MAIHQVSRLAVAALVLGAADAARVGIEDLQAAHAPGDNVETLTGETEQVNGNTDLEDSTATATGTSEPEKEGWGSKIGKGFKAAGTFLFTRKECCCSKEEPTLYYLCLPKEAEESKAESVDLSSVMFRSRVSLQGLSAMTTAEKREVIPAEHVAKGHDREEADKQPLTVEQISDLDFHAHRAHKCVDGKLAKQRLGESTEAVIDTYQQLIDDSGIENLAGSFYRYKLAGQSLAWSEAEGQFNIGAAIYKKKEDKPSWQCLDEEGDVAIRFNAKKGAECENVQKCKKLLHAPQCGPEGTHALYELHGRSDGQCEHLYRGQKCSNGGFENTLLKPIYGDWHGKYSLCLCDGQKKC